MAWIFSQETEGLPSSSALEAASKLHGAGQQVKALHVGPGSDEAFRLLGDHGVSSIAHLDAGDTLPAAAAAAALADLLEDGDRLVLFGSGNTDRDVAGRLSARIGAPVLANAVDIALGETTSATNAILGGTIEVTTEPAAGSVAIVITRPKAFEAAAGAGLQPEVIAIDPPDVGHAGTAAITDRHAEAAAPDRTSKQPISSYRAAGVLDLPRNSPSWTGWPRCSEAPSEQRGPWSIRAGFRIRIRWDRPARPSSRRSTSQRGSPERCSTWSGMKDSSTIIAINKDPGGPDLFDRRPGNRRRPPQA